MIKYEHYLPKMKGTGMSTALLIVEVQNDYFPNGRIPLERSLDIAAKIDTVLHDYREKKKPVIHVQHISTHPDATYFLPCTKGAEFYQTTQPEKNEAVIKKHYPNSFKDTSLLNYLTKNKIKHLVICGMMTHLSIDATVRAAYDLGFTCTVLSDACAARALDFNHTTITEQSVNNAFLAALQPAYANVLSSSDHLQKTARQMAVSA